MDCRPLFAAACLLGVAALGEIANAQAAHARFPVEVASVIASMERKQLPTKDVKVSMSAPISALTVDPQLEVQTVTVVSAHEMRLKISCQNHSECLPFFVTATYPDAVNEKSLPAKHDQAAAPAPVSQNHVANAATVAPDHDASIAPRILKSGAVAKLDIEGERIHIELDVICLSDGAAGDRIRVTSRDHKQFYVAQVVTPTQLKGSL